MDRLFLVPMEGLGDCVLRDVLTQAGGYDGAVTEFVRVSNSLLPHRTFRRISPEFDNGSRTPAGTPVVVQLFGSDPACLAENAARLAELSPAGIDLNFGCPAPMVNRHGGGAMLLDDPAHLARIVSAVRRAVPEEIPVSAKMRLGVRDASKTVACAHALADGGVASLVVHARTRDAGADDYLVKPFGVGELLARVRAQIWRHVYTDAGEQTIHFGAVRIDFVRRLVERNGLPLHLTPIEYRLLVCLASQPNRVITYRQLLQAVWGPGRAEDTHYVRVHMANLRKKIENDSSMPKYIVTELGVGYRFVPEN